MITRVRADSSALLLTGLALRVCLDDLWVWVHDLKCTSNLAKAEGHWLSRGSIQTPSGNRYKIACMLHTVNNVLPGCCCFLYLRTLGAYVSLWESWAMMVRWLFDFWWLHEVIVIDKLIWDCVCNSGISRTALVLFRYMFYVYVWANVNKCCMCNLSSFGVV